RLVEAKGGSGIFFADLHGTLALHGSEEAVLGKRRRLAEREGFAEARCGIADTRFAAFAAATVDEGGVAVPPDEEGKFLGPLPLRTLPIGEELSGRLGALGIETLGEFAALPPASVERRYGVDGVVLHRLARGIDDTPLAVARVEEEIAASEDLEAPCESLEEVGPLIERLLGPLLERLAASGRACRALAVRLALADGSAREWR